ncbi:NUDIX hydrolase [Tepidiforma sp.]|uniref:NUDIX hydrolase n=1 Tax=Tepidiforma sp. TaxID=2682230 RepID=UPI002ADE859A|nr:NUDIX domain-containing protein [Tepidiforma sp.]
MPVAVVLVIFTVRSDRLNVLLIERAAEPCRGQWALPGGLLLEGETLDAAAKRKLADETGVADVFLEQLYTFDRLGRGRAEAVVSYFALVDSGRARLRPESEWRPAWHPVRSLPPLAFENDRVIAYAEKRLRGKLEYTNVVYSLLPERFTLTRMQQTYEAILGERLDKRNFRRRVVGLGIVRPTDSYEKQGPHRPAMLYEFTRREPMVL